VLVACAANIARWRFGLVARRNRAVRRVGLGVLEPQRAGPNRELNATLFEVVRLPRDVATGWLPAR